MYLWRCLFRTCQGTAAIEDNNLKILNSHNHDPDFLKIKRLVIMKEIKNRAMSCKDSPKAIITEITPELEPHEIQILPKLRSITDKVTRIRTRANLFITQYGDIPKKLQIDLRGNLFLRHDEGVLSEDRFLIFCSDYCSKLLENSSTIMIDGTFYSAPKDFYQLIIVYGQVFNRILPLAFILSSFKKEESYQKILLKLREIVNLTPKHIYIDFEYALYNSVKSVNRESEIHGCIFHFGQSIWRNVQKLGLCNDYLKCPEVKKAIKRIMTLVFVPQEEITKEFLRIVGELKDEIYKKIEKFIIYFENNYVGKYHYALCIKNPLFNQKFWSLNQSIKDQLPRSINSAEAYHRNLKRFFQTAHPNLARLINIFQQEEECVRVKTLQDKIEIEVSLKKLKKDFKLSVVCSNYYLYQSFEFYDAIDKIYSWKLNKE